MNDQSHRPSGFFSSFVQDSRRDSRNEPHVLSYLSPYTDSRFSQVAQQPQFIVPEGQVEQRGRLELMFFTIGGAVLAGGLFAGTNGLYTGLREANTRENAILSRNLKRTM
ncbi:hypothetical protein ACOME3_007013 [Neoechinorhynchus agilis]